MTNQNNQTPEQTTPSPLHIESGRELRTGLWSVTIKSESEDVIEEMKKACRLKYIELFPPSDEEDNINEYEW